MKEKNGFVVNPIYELDDVDIWRYIAEQGIKVNPLYDQGYDRVGCPFASYKKRVRDFNRYPTFKRMYILAFDRMIAENHRRGATRQWKTGQEVSTGG